MKPIISVIIPVYKVEPYLRKCVDSVCNQTFRDLEIILVDDGSPDNCGKICDEYAAKDNRIVVIHKENGGISSARNAGIDIAQGEFLGFVDSDDWIEPDMYEFLYNNLIQEDADISVCGGYEHRDDRITDLIDPSIRAVASGHDAVDLFLPMETAGNASWNKLFRRHMFSQIRFPEGKLWEDSFIMVRLIDSANKVVFDMQQKHNYLRRAGSITMSGYRPGLRDYTQSQAFIYNYTREKYPDLTVKAISSSVQAHLFVLNLMLVTSKKVDKDFKKEVIGFLRENRKVILQSAQFSKKRKMMIRLLCTSEWLYRIVVLILLQDNYKAVDY